MGLEIIMGNDIHAAIIINILISLVGSTAANQ